MNDLKLINGQTAKFINVDDWDRPVYLLENDKKVCCINLNGTCLYTITEYGEPCSPLGKDYQPVKE